MKQDERHERHATGSVLMNLAAVDMGKSLRRFDFPRCSEVAKALLRFVYKPTPPNERTLFELIGKHQGGSA